MLTACLLGMRRRVRCAGGAGAVYHEDGQPPCGHVERGRDPRDALPRRALPSALQLDLPGTSNVCAMGIMSTLSSHQVVTRGSWQEEVPGVIKLTLDTVNAKVNSDPFIMTVLTNTLKL